MTGQTAPQGFDAMKKNAQLAFHACRALDALRDPRHDDDDVQTARRCYLMLAARHATPATRLAIALAQDRCGRGDVSTAAKVMQFVIADHRLGTPC